MNPMKIALLAAATLLFLPVPAAYAVDSARSGGIDRPGDVLLTCEQLEKEVGHLDNIIVSARETVEDSEMTSTGITVAKTIGTFAIGTLTGALGIIAAGKIVDEATDSKSEEATAMGNAAEQRQSRLVAIHETKGCEGDLRLAARRLSRVEPASGGTTANRDLYGPPVPRHLRAVKRRARFNE